MALPQDAVVFEATYRPAVPEIEIRYRPYTRGKNRDQVFGELVVETYAGPEAVEMARELFPSKPRK